MATRMVGRQAVVARALGVMDAPAESALLVLGEAGAGKSLLLERLAAALPGQAVLVRVNPAEAQWSFAGVSAVLASVFQPDAAERAQREIAAHADLWSVAQELLAALRRAHRAVVLLVDDIDAMDGRSRVVLGLVAGRLPGTGVRLICTAGDADRAEPLSGIASTRLDPLDDDDAYALAQALAGGAAHEGTVRILVQGCGGNAGALVEAVRSLTDEQARGLDPLALPLCPGRSAVERGMRALEPLGERQRRALQRLALAPGGESPPAMLGDDADAVESLVLGSVVVRRGQRVAVRDPLVRSYLFHRVHMNTTPEENYAAAADAATLDVCASGWYESFATARDVLPARLLMDAVGMAEQGRLLAAVEIAERATLLGADTPARAFHRVRLVKRLLFRAELAIAERYMAQTRVELLEPDDRRRHFALRLMLVFLRTGGVADEDIPAWSHAYALLPGATAYLSTLAASFRAERWEPEEALRLLESAPVHGDDREAEATGALRSATLDTVVALLGEEVSVPPLVPETEHVDALAASGVPRADRSLALLLQGHAQSIAENHSAARSLYSFVLAQSSADEPVWEESVRYFLAVNEVRAGNYGRAAGDVEAWQGLAYRNSTASRVLLRAWHAQAAGDGDLAASLLAESHARAARERTVVAEARALTIEGRIALTRGRAQEAVDLLRRVDAAAFPLANPGLVRHTADFVEALVLCGRVREAQDVVDRFAQRVEAHPRSRWAALALVRARALVAADAELSSLYGPAIASFTSADSRYELGRTMFAFARRFADLGLAEAHGAHAAAMTAFDEAGAAGWTPVTDVAGEPSAEGEHPALRMLTEEERVVVQKVREGYRNREIAASLFVSQRTVELRLTSVYRKLGVRSRSHLVAILH